MNTTHTTAIGSLDLGGTVFKRMPNGDMYPFRGAYKAIKHLLEGYFGRHYFHVISRVQDDEHEEKVVKVLFDDGFFELTGMLPANTHFCRKREEKAEIARKLGITHHADDQPEVMIHMPFVPNRLLFRPGQGELEKYYNRLDGVAIKETWEEVEGLWLPATERR